MQNTVIGRFWLLPKIHSFEIQIFPQCFFFLSTRNAEGFRRCTFNGSPCLTNARNFFHLLTSCVEKLFCIFSSLSIHWKTNTHTHCRSSNGNDQINLHALQQNWLSAEMSFRLPFSSSLVPFMLFLARKQQFAFVALHSVFETTKPHVNIGQMAVRQQISTSMRISLNTFETQILWSEWHPLVQLVSSASAMSIWINNTTKLLLRTILPFFSRHFFPVSNNFFFPSNF